MVNVVLLYHFTGLEAQEIEFTSFKRGLNLASGLGLPRTQSTDGRGARVSYLVTRTGLDTILSSSDIARFV